MLIPGATRQAVSEAIASRLSANAWTVTKTTDYSLELEQPAKGAAGFFGSILSVNKFVTEPVYRLTFSISESGGSVRVTAAQALVQNPHTGTESPVRLDRKKHEAPLWDLLESVKNELARVSSPEAPVSPAATAPEVPPDVPLVIRPPVGQAQRPAPDGLTSFYDRFEDVRSIGTESRTVVLSNAPPSGVLYVKGEVTCRGDTISGPIAGKLSLVAVGSAYSNAFEATQLILLADGRRLVFGRLEHRERGSKMHSVTVPVSVDTMLLIAESRVVEGRLGEQDFAFDSGIYQSFRGLAQVIRSTQPIAPKLKVPAANAASSSRKRP